MKFLVLAIALTAVCALSIEKVSDPDDSQLATLLEGAEEKVGRRGRRGRGRGRYKVHRANIAVLAASALEKYPNKTLNSDQFGAIVLKYVHRVHAERIKRRNIPDRRILYFAKHNFRSWDKDNNGNLTKDEILQGLYGDVDSDRNGVLSAEEIYQLFDGFAKNNELKLLKGWKNQVNMAVDEISEAKRKGEKKGVTLPELESWLQAKGYQVSNLTGAVKHFSIVSKGNDYQNAEAKKKEEEAEAKKREEKEEAKKREEKGEEPKKRRNCPYKTVAEVKKKCETGYVPWGGDKQSKASDCSQNLKRLQKSVCTSCWLCCKARRRGIKISREKTGGFMWKMGGHRCLKWTWRNFFKGTKRMPYNTFINREVPPDTGEN